MNSTFKKVISRTLDSRSYLLFLLLFLIVNFCQIGNAQTEKPFRPAPDSRANQARLSGLIQSKMHDEADKLADELFAKSPDPNYRVLKLLNQQVRYGRSDFSKVEAFAEELMQQYETDSYALSGVFNVLVNRRVAPVDKHLELAAKCMKRAYEKTGGSNPQIVIFYARARQQQASYDEAFEILRLAIKQQKTFTLKEVLRREVDSMRLAEKSRQGGSSENSTHGENGGSQRPFGVRYINDSTLMIRFLNQVASLERKEAFLTSNQMIGKLDEVKPADNPLADFNFSETSTTPVDDERLYQEKTNSVITIFGLKKTGNVFTTSSVSSGFVIGKNGICVSNYHVFGKVDQMYAARKRDGSALRITEFLAIDRLNDLLVFRVEADDLEPLSIKPWAPVGTDVRVISHPSGLSYTFAKGDLTRRFSKPVRTSSRNFRDYVSISADYAGGSSGGPVFDSYGNVVCVVDENRPLKSGISNNLQMTVKDTVPIEKLAQLIEQFKQ